jgi:predicted ATP-dependent protease
VEAGTFHVWTVDTLDDALELLVGRDAGLEDEQGRFPEGTINAAVDARLQRFAESSRRFQAAERGQASKDSAER